MPSLPGSSPLSPQKLIVNKIAKPASALVPYRSIAAISSSSSKPASAVTPHNVQGNPRAPPPLSVTGKVRREVPLPSQEGKKGVMQYALYVYESIASLSSISGFARGQGCRKVTLS
jgi:hypothetical protein